MVDQASKKTTNGFGIAALVFGIVACLGCWIPFCGLSIIPLALLGGFFGLIGLIISAAGSKSSVQLPIAGIIISGVAVVISVWATGKTSQFFTEVQEDVAWTHKAKEIAQTRLDREIALQKAMSYFSEISEIEWYEIQRNNIYIGFKQLPSNWQIIINGAALRGNETIDFGVHVWAINANKFNKGWRPGDGPYYGEVTARHGRIED